MTSFMSVWVEEQYNGWIMMVVGVGLGLGFDMGVVGLGCDGSWMGSSVGIGLDDGVGGVGDSFSLLGDVLCKKSHKDSLDVIVLGLGRFDGGLDGGGHSRLVSPLSKVIRSCLG